MHKKQKEKNKNPVPSKMYDSEYYEKYNHGYDEFVKDKSLMPDLEAKVSQINFKNKKVLDAACGRGEFVRYAALKGAEATGFDYSPSAIKICNDMIKDLDKKTKSKISFDVMDIKELGYGDNEFDLVVMFDIIEHLHHWELKKTMHEIHRVLKPGGEIYVHTSPNKIMMDLVRKVTRPFGVTLKSEEFHVNEITYKSMLDYTQYFEGKVMLEKDKNYWSKQMVFRGSFLKGVAKVLDLFVDFYPIHKLMSIKPFSVVTATDIWFLGKKPL
ncbi:MAG: class I SAM-dependent methyltransferase [Patescibacteria group bacterium]